MSFEVSFLGDKPLDTQLLNSELNQEIEDGYLGPDVVFDPSFTSHTSKNPYIQISR